MVTSVILFEDNDRLRESLAYLLDNDEAFTVLAHFNNCNNAASAITQLQPDTVLMDIDMPGPSGIQGVAAIKAVRPQTAVIMYTVFEDDDRLFQCLCAGADGYLLKKTPPAQLFNAIHDVMQGGAPMSPIIARKVLASFKHKQNPRQYNLSHRETEVLELLIKGYSIKIIASELSVAFDTVRSHLKNIYQKLHVQNKIEAVNKFRLL